MKGNYNNNRLSRENFSFATYSTVPLEFVSYTNWKANIVKKNHWMCSTQRENFALKRRILLNICIFVLRQLVLPPDNFCISSIITFLYECMLWSCDSPPEWILSRFRVNAKMLKPLILINVCVTLSSASFIINYTATRMIALNETDSYFGYSVLLQKGNPPQWVRSQRKQLGAKVFNQGNRWCSENKTREAICRVRVQV